ncbi:hypothetical protein [Microbacterium sp.]|uniref:hypothetical protein n=1 Tax=Microbacterium sp. TaxID=51671 RepID=UPI002E36C049|nr:hypothetical protein [Microbacterium sp.]HEX5728454.1 hypothetical protein [Microbacterium sp.]
MALTSTVLRDVGSARIGFVLAIEGYKYLLTDAKNVTPVLTAWVGSGWTQALPGLKVKGTIRQSLTPWAQTIDVPTLTFEILPDPTDQFGIDVWKSRPRFSTRLTAPFEAAADGSGTIEVEDTNGVPGSPPENQLFIGGREVEVTVASATSFTVAAAGFGKHQPFGAEADHYSDAVQTPADQNWDAGPAPVIRSTPTWIGKKVALRIHLINGEVWNTYTQAQLEFAGRIVSLREDPRTGTTIIGCEDLRGAIRDAVLLKAQWVGRVPSGIRLQAGDTFIAAESDYPSTYTESNPLTVVASGASGNDEVDEGYYELDEFLAILNRWVSSEALDAQWHFGIEAGNGGRRTVIRAVFGTDGDRTIILYSNSRHALQFLGFGGRSGATGGDGAILPTSDSTKPWRVVKGSDAGTTIVLTSSGPPYVTKPFQTDHRTSREVGLTLDLESSDGTWVTHSDFLPAALKVEVGPGEDRSLIRIGDSLFLARRVSATRLDDVGFSLNFAGYSQGDGPDVLLGRTVDDEDERMDVMQVVTLAGSFTDIVTRLIVSTDGRGINHGTFDSFPKGMGCPGIPFSLLGAPWLESVRALDQADKHESMMVVLDRPRKLVDILVPELVLRFGWIIWKDEFFQIVSPPSPSPISPDFTLDDSNKAAPAGQTDMLVSATEVTKEHLCNVIKVNYNRSPTGSFRDHLVVRDETSIATYGATEACTIDAVNSFSDAAGTGAAVESLAASLVARVLPAFGRPMKMVSRTIAPTLYHMAPGATVALSDSDVRDPTSGIRGLTNRGCIAFAVSHTFGHEGQDPFGEVELLFTDEDRCFPMAPAVEVDTAFSGTVDGITFTSGYANTAAGGPALKVKAHAYSRSTDPHDVSLLANGDLVRIYEIDPANPASITAWDRTLAASGAVDATDDYVRFTADLASPAYSTTLQYRIVPQLFSVVQESQELAAYIADEDGLIENLIEANEFGDDQSWGFTRTQPNSFPYRLPPNEADDEGRPVHGGIAFDHTVNLNVLISYITAPHMPVLYMDRHTNTVEDFRLLQVYPYFIGMTPHSSAVRKLVIAPILGIANAAETCSLRVTSSKFPPRGSSGAPPKFSGAHKQVTFTHTGSTTDTAVTAQELDVVPADIPGMTWVTVEIMTSDSAAQARLRGWQRFHLGPVNL